MRIGLVTTWASRLGGGVFEALVAHAELVRACGHEPVVFALADPHSEEDRARFRDAEVIACPCIGPHSPGLAPALDRALAKADLDLVHLHGIWNYPSHAAARWAARTGRPYVISPHGMLDPWITSRGRLKKAVAKLGYERRSWGRATRFHALTGAEARDIAAATGRTDEAIVIPNAVEPAAHAASDGPPTILYLGRIHPKKNLAGLIDGWCLAGDAVAATGARLVIAGWGQDVDVARLRARLADVGDTITFVGSIFGEHKAALLAEARHLVLPSFSEGLPMVILEAWAAGTPTLMSQGCNLPEGFEAGAAVDCGVDAGTIAQTLRDALALEKPEWEERSAAASTLASRHFSPVRIAERWGIAYSSLQERNGTGNIR